jgi:hypothetical protein
MDKRTLDILSSFLQFHLLLRCRCTAGSPVSISALPSSLGRAIDDSEGLGCFEVTNSLIGHIVGWEQRSAQGSVCKRGRRGSGGGYGILDG